MSAEKPALEPEMIPYGVKAVLVCLDAGPWRDGARAYFAAQGYYLMDEPDEELAAAKARLNALDVVLAGQGKAALLAELHGRPGLRRRETALFIVGDFASLDSWAAFSSAADWVLGQGDAPRAAELLTEALKRQEASREPWRLAEEASAG